MSRLLGCPFCYPETQRVFHEAPLVRCLWDGFPVSDGHALVVLRRHIVDWFDATREEQNALLAGVEIARNHISQRHSPDGFNVGVNVGEAAGQTVPHVHVHVIPRYRGDVADPRGGVRGVIPDKANYLLGVRDAGMDLPKVNQVFGSELYPLFPALVSEVADASRLDIAVAFVTEAGLEMIEQHLIELVDAGGRQRKLRFLTGDYLGVTEPRALWRLLDLGRKYRDNATVRVFQTDDRLGFHPKAYLIHKHSFAATAFVGSSNLTRHALERGVEWNQRFEGRLYEPPISGVLAEFERLFVHPNTRPLTAHWIDRYAANRLDSGRSAVAGVSPNSETESTVPTPHGLQADALAALSDTRALGNRAGLVVMATGLGKTWLAAFDSVNFIRVLFVAHREEILNQAMRTFRAIRPDANLGLYAGGQHDVDADVLFASVQTLSRLQHLQVFVADHFDYIVIDEFHHAAARTYRRLIDHFEPNFLLGLTATPERTDGGDLLALCGENLVFRCDLVDGIERALLSPFKYFGVPDDVDFANIPWRSGRFDPEQLEHAVATTARAQSALDQWTRRGQTRALAFCVSMRHADFMAQFFVDHGVKAVAVHSGPTSAPRTLTLERLAKGELDVVFAVDMFNEGVDIPTIDTVLMLRPTESKTIWLQQFGRGLRKAAGKAHLSVIDYIGNHRSFLQVPAVLLPGADTTPGQMSLALQRLERDELMLPAGCTVEYDLEALNILKQLAKPAAVSEQVAAWYRSFSELHDRRPTAVEAFHEGYDPKSVRKSYGSWLGFVRASEGMSAREQAAFDNNQPFFESLESTPMSKSYKMLVLQAMLACDQFPGTIHIDWLVREVAKIASRIRLLSDEFGAVLADASALRHLLEKNPIRFWCDGRGMGNEIYFSYVDGQFATQNLSDADRESMSSVTREIADWRLAQYLDRLHDETKFARQIVCSVSHAGDRPILFLPNRDQHPGIPEGWTPVKLASDDYEVNFVKVAVNVMRVPGQTDNVLGDVLRRFFGPDAGQPGTAQRVRFELGDDGYTLTPLKNEAAKAELWREYMRKDIPTLWGLTFNPGRWNQGVVRDGSDLFLLVSLNKTGLSSEHQYADQFVDRNIFQWVSQTRTKQDSVAGARLRDHAKDGIAVHLFVRSERKTPSGTGSPFIYCGDVDFHEWEGDQPITVRWDLQNAVPEHLAERLGLPPSGEGGG